MVDYNFKNVLVLMKEGATRQTFAKALTSAGFKVDFCSTTNDALELINELSAGIFIHDFETTDKTQGSQFQQRLARLEVYNSLIRILYVQEISPKVLALANDAQIRRIVSYNSVNPEILADEIKMITKTGSAFMELQRRIKEIAAKGGNTAAEIDKEIEQTYSSFGHDPQIRVEFAGVCLRRSQLDDAKNHATEVLRKDPLNVRAMSMVSRVLMKQGKLDEAIQIMEKANGLSPNNPERLIALGEAFFQSGDKPKAKGFFNQALSIAPEASEAKKGLGQVALAEGDATAALDLLVNSCTEEESAGFFNNAAVAAKRAGQHEKALHLYDSAMKSLKTNKLRPLIYFNIALVHADQKNFEQALKSLKQALRFDKTYEKAIRLKEKLEKEHPTMIM